MTGRDFDRWEARHAQPIATQIVDIVRQGVRVLATRDQVPITEAQVDERARNIAAGILASFDLYCPEYGSITIRAHKESGRWTARLLDVPDVAANAESLGTALLDLAIAYQRMRAR